MNPDDAAALRAPFPKDVIEYKEMHGRSLAYVNHALVTDRLIQVDPCWTWEPMAIDDRGAPRLDMQNGLWIRLTILGVTRIGYGASEPHQKGADAVKTAISDAIKNAAMRFGVALDLWGADGAGEPSLAVVRSLVQEPLDDNPWAVTEAEESQDSFAVSCERGCERVFRKAKDDKWAAYFCPNKVEGCQPIDARSGRAWPKK